MQVHQLSASLKAPIKEAKLDHNLDDIKPSKKFYTRMERRAKRKNIPLNEEQLELAWMYDDAEYASRIWEWWKLRVRKFHFYAVAIRLVVLVQMSSCSVERVFSRLKLIVDKCGNNMKEDMVLLCIIMQCNGDVEELLSELHEEGVR